MSAEKKSEILRAVEACGLPVRQALVRLDVPISTYYRWKRMLREKGQTGLHDRSPYKGRIWNELLPEEREKIFEIAMPADLEPLSGISFGAEEGSKGYR